MNMKREETKDNSAGTVSVVFGILSILVSAVPGILLALISLGFGIKQWKMGKNSWAKAGIILAVIGILVGVVTTWVLVNYSFGNINFPTNIAP